MILSVSVCLSACDDALACSDSWLDFLLSVAGFLLQNLMILSYSDRCLVSLLRSVTSLLVLQLLDRLAYDFHQILLKSLLLKYETVLVPDEIGNLGIPAVLLHAALEKAQNELVVWVLSELELAAVVHELAELLRVSLAQLVDSDFEFLLLDVVVLFVLRTPWQTLPRKTPAQEVQQHMADSLKVVATGLLVPNVRVDTCVPGGASQVLTFPEGDVLAVRVLVALGETKIDDVDVILVCVVAPNQEVVGLNVSVDNALFVDLLNSLNLFNHIFRNFNNFHTIWIAMQSTVFKSNFLLHS